MADASFLGSKLISTGVGSCFDRLGSTGTVQYGTTRYGTTRCCKRTVAARAIGSKLRAIAMHFLHTGTSL